MDEIVKDMGGLNQLSVGLFWIIILRFCMGGAAVDVGEGEWGRRGSLGLFAVLKLEALEIFVHVEVVCSLCFGSAFRDHRYSWMIIIYI